MEVVNIKCVANREKMYTPEFIRRCVKDILLLKLVICIGTYDTGRGICKNGDVGTFGETGNINTRGMSRRSATNTLHKAAPSYTTKSKFLRDCSSSVLFNKCSQSTLRSSVNLKRAFNIPSSIAVFMTTFSMKVESNGTWYVL